MIPATAILRGGRGDGMTCRTVRWPDHAGGQPVRRVRVHDRPLSRGRLVIAVAVVAAAWTAAAGGLAWCVAAAAVRLFG